MEWEDVAWWEALAGRYKMVVIDCLLVLYRDLRFLHVHQSVNTLFSTISHYTCINHIQQTIRASFSSTYTNTHTPSPT